MSAAHTGLKIQKAFVEVAKTVQMVMEDNVAFEDDDVAHIMSITCFFKRRYR